MDFGVVGLRYGYRYFWSARKFFVLLTGCGRAENSCGDACSYRTKVSVLDVDLGEHCMQWQRLCSSDGETGLCSERSEWKVGLERKL